MLLTSSFWAIFQFVLSGKIFAQLAKLNVKPLHVCSLRNDLISQNNSSHRLYFAFVGNAAFGCQTLVKLWPSAEMATLMDAFPASITDLRRALTAFSTVLLLTPQTLTAPVLLFTNEHAVFYTLQSSGCTLKPTSSLSSTGGKKLTHNYVLYNTFYIQKWKQSFVAFKFTFESGFKRQHIKISTIKICCSAGTEE